MISSSFLRKRKTVPKFFHAVLLAIPLFALARPSPVKQEVEAFKPLTSAEQEILSVVRPVYESLEKDFVPRATKPCAFFEKYGKSLTVDLFNKYSKQLQDGCLLFGMGRYDSPPIIPEDVLTGDPTLFSLVKIFSPYQIEGDTIVEVRFWSEIKANTAPIDQDHGGAIVHLRKESGRWKISNIEACGFLKAKGFESLMDGPLCPGGGLDPRRAEQVDYRESLCKPKFPAHFELAR